MPTTPRTEKRPHAISAHGHTRVDDYYWLRDDTRNDPDVIAHLKQENKYFDRIMAPTRALQNTLFDEMTARLDPDESSVPYPLGGSWYYRRYETGREYPIQARRKNNMATDEEILLDCNQRAQGHEYYSLGGFEVSDDGTRLAIAEDTVSRGLHTIRVLDLETHEFTTDLITGTAASMAWSADGRYLFYLKKHPQTLLAYQVMRHELGSDCKQDVLVYEESDNSFYTSLERSRSRDYIFLNHHSSETSEVQYLPATRPLEHFQPFLPRQCGHEYDLDHAAGRFYIRSNFEAINFRVFSTSIENATNISKWQQITAARSDAMVESIQAFDDWLLISERSDGLRRIRVMAHDGSVDRYLEADESDYVMWPVFNAGTHTSKLRYAYSSLVTPTRTLEIDLKSGITTVLKEERFAGYERSHFVTERRWIKARDGARVPVSLVRHKDTPMDGTAAALIYAYGSYGHSIDPFFRSSIISLLERRFIYVIAHVRGGEEMGRLWYYNGKKLNKYNTFNDFIDVTHKLQEKCLIDPEHSYAMGGSAGGLLIGAVINIAPQLFHGAIAAVPFVDVVTSMLDESIPLTSGEFDEWGNPNIRKYYDYMLSYSPYDQVRAQPYPNLMVTTGLHDSQVQYWEPAKWVARLRELRSNNNLLILHTDMDAGHGGASGRYRRYKEIAREYAFLLSLAEQVFRKEQ